MNALVRYEAARKALADAHSLYEIKDVRDKAAAMQSYARAAKDKQLISRATELRLLAEDKAGGELRAMAERGERRHSGGASLQPERMRLKDLGVSEIQSHRWQAFAALPQDVKDAKISGAIKKSIAAVEGTLKRTRSEMHAEDEARVAGLVPVEGKFKTLVLDPPWDYEWLSVAGRAKPGYSTMSHEQLMALDVAGWAESDCHLYLWATNNFMTRAVELMAHWGFAHKTVLTWIKPRWGLGSYFRNSTEHVLFGVRGTLRTRSDSIATHFEAPLGDHSEKPEKFYEIVRAASYLPAGEGFQRKDRDGFVNLFSPASVFEAAQ